MAKTEQLFRACRRYGDGAAREELLVRFLPLARKLARRYSHASALDEDLVQVASIALLKAIDRFDPDRGSAFQSFAIPTILGELRRHFRDTSWALHVARAAQERALAVQETIDRLSARHGHSPTVQEIAVYLELSEEEVLDGMQAGRAYSTMSLDAPAPSGEEDGDTTLAAELGRDERGYELIETGSAIADALDGLAPRDRQLLQMRFAAGLTQGEIGEQLGVSQMQVSRLLARTLDTLRARLAGTYAS
ncbi:MAG TPA: SigB/SigF/SigG family RNA polymerase sigma factor [Solirubrobacteraceae bacterium]|nr:SigB/SigF/SigG family RNA polymerase sigma factor [Solirubrobacteraceae bacterium]